MNNNVQFTYIQDTNVPERVLTIATQKVAPGQFAYSFCVNLVKNKVTIEKLPSLVTTHGYSLYKTIETDVVDPFSKKEARVKCVGILKSKEKTLISVPDKFNVKLTVLEAIAANKMAPSTVRRLAKHQLKTFVRKVRISHGLLR